MNESITKWLNKHPQSTVEEMRFLRRELIAKTLRNYGNDVDLRIIIIRVRMKEIILYGQELQAYK